MHQVIRVLVFGMDETETLDAARRVMQDHLMRDFPMSGVPFDSAVDFANSAFAMEALNESDKRLALLIAAQACRDAPEALVDEVEKRFFEEVMGVKA